ncbi:anti-anti-sigma factor [Catenuloplanes atrovinosus]|uniref:Anti-anti-sigma factor n=2 Tax=Catenuloplanes atrovinosus TaxID=137266 RepID=A0AAE3YSP6_9ACTN|nr:anti-anti-sigma factor [Catenuloplanes atrovinosus]
MTMSFTGDLDTDTAQEFSAAVLRTVDAHREPSVRIDLADVDFLAAAGVRALRHCQQYATGQGRRLVVCNPQPSVRHVLEIAAALDLLETAG